MAHQRQLIITKEDHQRLQSVLNSDFTAAISGEPYLRALRGEVNKATVVESKELPPDVVTMNSIVRLRETRYNDVDTYRLVYPEDADIAAGKLSILAPIGTAILGYRVGDSVQRRVPSGTVCVRIEEIVFQPERDGVAV